MIRAVFVGVMLALSCCTTGVDVDQVEELSTAAGPLCVSNGGDLTTSAIAIATTDPAMRGSAPATDGHHASLAFTVRGETAPVVPLSDGSIRHQVCLKLRAADGCNVVYACWRDKPQPWLEVQVKSNPGKHTSASCGAGGYIKATPTWSTSIPSWWDGAPHELAADLEGTQLALTADGALAWTGAIDQSALLFDGPAGVRSDNVRWDGVLGAARLDCSAASD